MSLDRPSPIWPRGRLRHGRVWRAIVVCVTVRTILHGRLAEATGDTDGIRRTLGRADDALRDVLKCGINACCWTCVSDAGRMIPDGRANAVAHLSALYAFDHPAQAAAAALFRPMVDAMEAGLFLYWVAPREVICVPRPALHAVDGLLHRDDAPAIEWASGEMYFFCHGERAEPVPPIS